MLRLKFLLLVLTFMIFVSGCAKFDDEIDFEEPEDLADAEFGKIDLMSGSVMYTEERAERVIFPETPLYTLPISVMTRKVSSDSDLSNIKRPADLR